MNAPVIDSRSKVELAVDQVEREAERASGTIEKPRSDQDLIKATNTFAQEHRARSWFHLLTTTLLTIGFVVAPALIDNLALSLACATVAGLLVVRMFILFHDYRHGSIFRGSLGAKAILETFGIVALTPGEVWSQTHNYHHPHTAKIVGSHVGSYMMLTTAMYQALPRSQQMMYRLIRHPLTILFGYLTVFIYGFCTSAFVRNPKKNRSAAVSLVAHVIVGGAVLYFFGARVFWLCFIVPHFVSHALGAYLFYAQHNFPNAYVHPRENWSFVRAALDSSSYMKLGPIWNYFTGNIGYHHVHHLNHRIPFYRLPEAMAAIEELQHPRGVTSLKPREIAACFQLKLWDPDQGRLVGYPRS
jgi:omega-6 fatty acid desaturase (delta-12 desaturase)